MKTKAKVGTANRTRTFAKPSGFFPVDEQAREQSAQLVGVGLGIESAKIGFNAVGAGAKGLGSQALDEARKQRIIEAAVADGPSMRIEVFSIGSCAGFSAARSQASASHCESVTRSAAVGSPGCHSFSAAA